VLASPKESTEMPANLMTRRMALSLGLAAGAIMASPAFAEGDSGNPDEAKAMAIQAAQLIRDKGVDPAISEFEKKPGPYWDRDLYVFIFANDGTALFNANTPTLKGKKLIELKDASGFAIVKAFVALKEPGWVDYQWADPTTKKVRAKQSYIIPLGDLVVGVGAYKRT
jgi:cytochrome c